ncbi:MAG: hypothetical protein JWM99_1082 [Verrucomicrobiales bacterium]|nr:hypothetical protein [Verrucomicrobiales bacterium]
MRSRIKNWCVVTLLILAVGGHWALLQSAAYVGMAVTYSKKASFKEALARTLDGQHPCQLCNFVKEGKKAEKHSQSARTDSKIDFLLQIGVAFLYPPETILTHLPPSANIREVRVLPLLQPPRSRLS